MPKILIIDDDSDLRQALQVRLEKEHFQVITAESGTAGLQAAQIDAPNLIVLDVSMRDTDGIQVLEQLRNNIVTWDLPVVVLTAQGENASRSVEPRLGRTRFMRKPLSPRHLVSEIARLLAGAGN